MSGDLKRNKEEFASELFARLSKAKYAILKCVSGDIGSIGVNSDIDLAVDREASVLVRAFAREHRFVRVYREYSSSFMTTIYLSFLDYSFLEIDLIHDFIRKDLRYLRCSELLDRARPNSRGLIIPSVEYQFLYVSLFYFLNNVKIDQKYVDYFSSMPLEVKENILNFILNKYGMDRLSWDDLVVGDVSLRRSFKRIVVRQNCLFERIQNTWFYLLDVIRNISKSRLVTFSGVDGAGKSTLIECFSNILKSKYRRDVVLLRHRPSIVPILSAFRYGKEKAEKISAERLPRMGGNKSVISSLLRFAYYLFDYLIGQWIIFFKHALHGRIIIYDRYYFDFICDPQRSNIKVSNWLARAFYVFIFKPDMSFFLKAPAEVVWQRKKELDVSVINELNLKYENLFSSFSSDYQKYRVLENIDKAATLEKIESAYVQIMWLVERLGS